MNLIWTLVYWVRCFEQVRVSLSVSCAYLFTVFLSSRLSTNSFRIASDTFCRHLRVDSRQSSLLSVLLFLQSCSPTSRRRLFPSALIDLSFSFVDATWVNGRSWRTNAFQVVGWWNLRIGLTGSSSLDQWSIVAQTTASQTFAVDPNTSWSTLASDARSWRWWRSGWRRLFSIRPGSRLRRSSESNI